MISFDPQNPFPLVYKDSSLINYESEKNHSEKVDEWLGFNTKKVEGQIFSNNTYVEDFQPDKIRPEYWLGLAASSLQTPYTEIRFILEALNPTPGSKIVDLGCAYGRMAHVIGWHYKNINFIGYEFIKERIHAGLKSLSTFNYNNVAIYHADLSAPLFSPVAADFYFLYDFGSRRAVEKTLNDLKNIALSQKIIVVGRGRSCRDLIEHNHPWLSQVNQPKHFKNFSIYYS